MLIFIDFKPLWEIVSMRGIFPLVVTKVQFKGMLVPISKLGFATRFEGAADDKTGLIDNTI